jgi:tRNA-dihydrouridine synthase A
MHEGQYKFCVAPMMDWTDRHCRVFHRGLTRHARLYTEMVTTGAVIHGDRERLLGFSNIEHPLAVQLGGSNRRDLAESARIAEGFGYDEVNLNVGCPSDRVQDGRFGACLMREPDLVAEGVAAMKQAVGVPVTVKCRIGVDEQDPAEALWRLAGAVHAAGADALIVHARKAWLQGLSPKENRDIPPLDYPLVHKLKADYPAWQIILNGGLASPAAGLPHLDGSAGIALDGLMLGRAAYQDPWCLLDVDPLLFGTPAPSASPRAAAEAFLPYLEAETARGTRLHAMVKHTLGLFPGVAGARLYRRHIAEESVKPGADAQVYRDALSKLLDGPPVVCDTAA